MTQRFIPQPYPLYAVTVEKAENPPRLALTLDPVHLVVGWWTEDDGSARPTLGGARPSEAWDGPVFYEETRERAEATAKELAKFDRTTIRDARVINFLERMDKAIDRVADRWGSAQNGHQTS